MSGCDEKRALRVASAASAISVTRQGASPSIPTVDEVKTLADEDDGVAYMPFYSENIKSADPVTYDDN